MSQFNHLVLALPIEKLGILAQQAGVTAPATINPDDINVEGTPTGQLLEAIAARVRTDTGLDVEPFTNSEWEDGALFGLELHSTYTDEGIAEATRAATVMNGYSITPELWARAGALKAALTKSLAGFGEAQLAVIAQHW